MTRWRICAQQFDVKSLKSLSCDRKAASAKMPPRERAPAALLVADVSWPSAQGALRKAARPEVNRRRWQFEPGNI